MKTLDTPELRSFLEDLNNSLYRYTGTRLVEQGPDLPERIFRLSAAVVAHGTEADPVFCFGNQKALDLFEMDWQVFTSLPSRLSAEPVNRTERAAMLSEVRRQGFTDAYQGVRISSSGRRFFIPRATVWNVVDGAGHLRGQAARFDTWESRD